MPDTMWRLTTCYDSEGHPFLESTNGHQGRQVWVYDEDAGTDVERQEVSNLREAFTTSRRTQKHSSDELLRIQKIDKSKARLFSCERAVETASFERAAQAVFLTKVQLTMLDSASCADHQTSPTSCPRNNSHR